MYTVSSAGMFAGGEQQTAQLGGSQVAPAAVFESIQTDIHDPYPLQAVHPVAADLAHAPDLAVKPLGENDAEGPGADAAGLAASGGGVQFRQAHAVAHSFQNLVRDRPIHGNDVFLLMFTFGAQDLVDDVPVTGEQYQALGLLVQAADGEDAFRIVDKSNDIPGHVALGGAGDAGRLVQGDINMFLSARRDEVAVDAHLVAFSYLRPRLRPAAIDGHAAFFDPRIRFAAGTPAGTGDVFIETHGSDLGHGSA